MRLILTNIALVLWVVCSAAPVFAWDWKGQYLCNEKDMIINNFGTVLLDTENASYRSHMLAGDEKLPFFKRRVENSNLNLIATSKDVVLFHSIRNKGIWPKRKHVEHENVIFSSDNILEISWLPFYAPDRSTQRILTTIFECSKID